MALVVSVSVYGINGSDIAGGQTVGLTVANIQNIRPAAANTTMGGVTINSVITYRKNSYGIVNNVFFSPTAVATVISACNA